MKKYFLIKDNAQIGPFTLDEVVEQNISSDVFIWHDGLPNWVKVSEVEEVYALWQANQVMIANAQTPEREYFIIENNQQIGPITLTVIKARQILPNTPVWSNGYEDWVKASDITEFKPFLFPSSAPPPFASTVQKVKNSKFLYISGSYAQDLRVSGIVLAVFLVLQILFWYVLPEFEIYTPKFISVILLILPLFLKWAIIKIGEFKKLNALFFLGWGLLGMNIIVIIMAVFEMDSALFFSFYYLIYIVLGGMLLATQEKMNQWGLFLGILLIIEYLIHLMNLNFKTRLLYPALFVLILRTYSSIIFLYTEARKAEIS